jgi:hypothetical protein
MHFQIVKMYKDKVVNKNVKNIFLSMCDVILFFCHVYIKFQFNRASAYTGIFASFTLNKGNNKITELRTILQGKVKTHK